MVPGDSAATSIILIGCDHDRFGDLKAAVAAGCPDVVLTPVADQSEALTYLHAKQYDIVIVASRGAGKHDLDFVRRLRAEASDPALLVLLPRNRGEDKAEFLRAGASRCLVRAGRWREGLVNVVRAAREQESRVKPRRSLKLRGQPNQGVDLIRITAGTLYHEICNPLMTILGMTELIMAEAATLDDAVADKVAAIRDSASRIQSTLDRLLNINEAVLRDTASGHMIDTRPSSQTSVK